MIRPYLALSSRQILTASDTIAEYRKDVTIPRIISNKATSVQGVVIERIVLVESLSHVFKGRLGVQVQLSDGLDKCESLEEQKKSRDACADHLV